MAITSFIKAVLPKFQFAAVCITIVLGAHTIWDRFFHQVEPVLEWSPTGFAVDASAQRGVWVVSVSRRRLRDDCPLRNFEAQIQDSAGFLHNVTTTINRNQVPSERNVFETYTYYVRILDPSVVAPGRARFMGTLVYDCRDGVQIINYPDVPGLRFEIR